MTIEEGIYYLLGMLSGWILRRAIERRDAAEPAPARASAKTERRRGRGRRWADQWAAPRTVRQVTDTN